MIDDAEIDRLLAVDAAATPGRWEWWTSNSMRRLTAEGGRQGGVLHAFRASDGVPDVAVSAEDMAVIVEARHALRPLVEEVVRLRREVAHLQSRERVVTEGQRIAMAALVPYREVMVQLEAWSEMGRALRQAEAAVACLQRDLLTRMGRR